MVFHFFVGFHFVKGEPRSFPVMLTFPPFAPNFDGRIS
jgi:hypothetical protein